MIDNRSLRKWLTERQYQKLRDIVLEELTHPHEALLDELILRKAIEFGYIPEREGRKFLVETIQSHSFIREIQLDQHHADTHDADVHAEEHSEDEDDVLFDLGGFEFDASEESYEEKEKTSEEPLPHFERYELLELLGEGGMGQVYKAYDRELHRYVAIKFLHAENPQSIERFIREARTQARVDNEYICKIYDVGTLQGHRFIAMQYIDGETFDKAAQKMTLDEKLQVMVKIALGLHAAHKVGLIHRDIKPANILIEQTETGEWHPYIMDFGLAREVAEKGMTTTGMVMGTPAYMSPEQALGEIRQIDRRSDVFSLGATFYEILCGHPPFTGDSTVEIMFAILEKDPPSLRRENPGIPEDIDTIIMKALEKEPGRRYQSARALAEDLQRYIDGEPIQARPPTLSYRLKKKIRKNRTLFVILTIAILTILSALSYAIYSRIQAHRQTIIAESFARNVNDIKTAIQYVGNLAPIHPIRRERILVRQTMRAIQSKMEELGSLAQGPGYAALGEGYLALGELNKARDYLQKAYDSGYRTDHVLYTFGLTLVRLYQKSLEELNIIGSKEKWEEFQKTIVKPLRRDALKYLKMVKNIPPNQKEYLNALVAYLEEKPKKTLVILERLTKSEPTDYEAFALMGQASLELGRKSFRKGQLKKALEYFKKAETYFQTSKNIARSFGQAYQGLCKVYNEYLEYQRVYQKEFKELYTNGVQFCQNALYIDPTLRYTYLYLSDLHWRYGEYVLSHGKDPSPYLQKSIETARQIIHIAPDPSYLYDNIGIAYSIMADYELKLGHDPSALVDKAVQAFNQALKYNPNFGSSIHNRALTWSIQVQYNVFNGIDPGNLFEKVETDMKNVMKLLESPQPYLNLNTLYVYWYHYKILHNQDLIPLIKKVCENAEVGWKLYPNTTQLAQLVLTCFRLKTKHAQAFDLTPQKSFDEAQRFFNSLPSEIRENAQAYASFVRILTAYAQVTPTFSPEFLKQLIRAWEKLSELSKKTQSMELSYALIELSIEILKNIPSHRASKFIEKFEKTFETILKKNQNNSELLFYLTLFYHTIARRFQGLCSSYRDKFESAYHQTLSLNPWYGPYMDAHIKTPLRCS